MSKPNDPALDIARALDQTGIDAKCPMTAGLKEARLREHAQVISAFCTAMGIEGVSARARICPPAPVAPAAPGAMDRAAECFEAEEIDA